MVVPNTEPLWEVLVTNSMVANILLHWHRYNKGENMTIFNDQTKTPDEEAEMKQLKDGVEKAKDRMREGREATPEEEPKKPKSKDKRK